MRGRGLSLNLKSPSSTDTGASAFDCSNAPVIFPWKQSWEDCDFIKKTSHRKSKSPPIKKQNSAGVRLQEHLRCVERPSNLHQRSASVMKQPVVKFQSENATQTYSSMGGNWGDKYSLPYLVIECYSFIECLKV